ncbi:hypothetical protein L596_029603 [Steinernema carpocapsae]|uniref:Uncharacterized protein n=1 Tax=Steinernema carpocapsae TaxID=34508 RepID=A0A4U5LV62_STECR|nr:hypothetical protein L596_029603 [Steinernema carpocapsae]
MFQCFLDKKREKLSVEEFALLLLKGQQEFELKDLEKDFENRVGWVVITALRNVRGPETVIGPDGELNAQAPSS